MTIIYGSSILPETFQATLNGRPFAGFAPIPGTVQTVTIPLSPRRNTLVLQVDGVNARGRIARERDRLTFVPSGAATFTHANSWRGVPMRAA